MPVYVPFNNSQTTKRNRNTSAVVIMKAIWFLYETINHSKNP